MVGARRHEELAPVFVPMWRKIENLDDHPYPIDGFSKACAVRTIYHRGREGHGEVRYLRPPCPLW
jgi:hypothetical protein